MDGFLSQLPYKCYLEEVASVGDWLQICPWVASSVGAGQIKRQRTWAGNKETAILLATSIVDEQSMYSTTYTAMRNTSATAVCGRQGMDLFSGAAGCGRGYRYGLVFKAHRLLYHSA